MEGESRGVLYPARLPEFHRLPAAPEVADLVRWFWIPEWDLPPGRTSRQRLVAYPASNLVVEPDLVGFSGPATKASHRDLSGTGWAVGALLRPAAVPALVEDPGALQDAYSELALPELHGAVYAAIALSVSPRTLQRLARRYVGVSPGAMIRRRRLQEAAERIRRHPGVGLAQVAAELGYADQAHLAGDFRRVLGFSATSYRSGLAHGE